MPRAALPGTAYPSGDPDAGALHDHADVADDSWDLPAASTVPGTAVPPLAAAKREVVGDLAAWYREQRLPDVVGALPPSMLRFLCPCGPSLDLRGGLSPQSSHFSLVVCVWDAQRTSS